MTSTEEPATGSGDNMSSSTTSTDKYELEPFSTFQSKVEGLMNELFRPHRVVQVHRMHGGGWNRVNGVTLSNGARYIVRTPYHDFHYDEVPDQVAALRFVHQHTSVPVPTVLHFNPEPENLLNTAYTVQNWVNGRCLLDVMRESDLSSRMAIARAVVQLVLKMYTTTPFTSAGLIRYRPAGADRPEGNTVLHLPNQDGTTFPPSSPITDSLTFFTTCCDTWIEKARVRGDIRTPAYMERFKAAVIALHAKHPFSNRFCIMHPDFEPRNILMHQTDDGEYVIDAALDYDGALVAPVEAVWTPPHWLWTWELDDTEGDRASRPFWEPVLPETKAVKAYVEQELDQHFPGFMETWRNGAVPRELLHFLVHGLGDSERANKLAGLDADPYSDCASASDSDNHWQRDELEAETVSDLVGALEVTDASLPTPEAISDEISLTGIPEGQTAW